MVRIHRPERQILLLAAWWPSQPLLGVSGQPVADQFEN
jgi:hypothetical protein